MSHLGSRPQNPRQSRHRKFLRTPSATTTIAFLTKATSSSVTETNTVRLDMFTAPHNLYAIARMNDRKIAHPNHQDQSLSGNEIEPNVTTRPEPRAQGPGILWAIVHVVTKHLKRGGWGIRTPEGFHPTRFPSVRHRPLGESSDWSQKLPDVGNWLDRTRNS